MGQSAFNTTARDVVIDRGHDPICTYAYTSTNTATTCTLADRWYFFNSTFTNNPSNNITGVTDGIQIDKDGTVEVEWQASGQASASSHICFGIVKNGTFASGLLDAGDDILGGSVGSYEADTVGATSGKGGGRSLWTGAVADGDVLTLVIRSSVAGVTFTPESAAASMHDFPTGA